MASLCDVMTFRPESRDVVSFAAAHFWSRRQAARFPLGSRSLYLRYSMALCACGKALLETPKPLTSQLSQLPQPPSSIVSLWKVPKQAKGHIIQI